MSLPIWGPHRLATPGPQHSLVPVRGHPAALEAWTAPLVLMKSAFLFCLMIKRLPAFVENLSSRREQVSSESTLESPPEAGLNFPKFTHMVLCLFGVLSAHILCLIFYWRIDLSVFSHELFLYLLAARIFYILNLLTFIDFSCNVFAPRMFLTFVLKSLVLFLAWTEWFLLLKCMLQCHLMTTDSLSLLLPLH